MRPRYLKLTCAVLVLVAALVLGTLAVQFVNAPTAVPAETATASKGTTPPGVITLDGKTWAPDYEKTNVLFLGVDQNLTPEVTEVAGTAGRSDVLLLLSLDHTDKTTRVLEISRDTLTNVKVYDANDRYLYLSQMQITMQHAYASSARRANQLSKNAVVELLGGNVNIDATISLSMDGIAALVDAMGGIPYTVQEDDTAIDPAFTKGAALSLTGAQALALIRSRDTEVSGSNDDRMARQKRFLWAVIEKAKTMGSATLLQIMQDSAAPYLESDVDGDTVSHLLNYTWDKNFVKLAGETRPFGVHDAYYLDEAAVQRQVVDLFYKAYP